MKDLYLGRKLSNDFRFQKFFATVFLPVHFHQNRLFPYRNLKQNHEILRLVHLIIYSKPNPMLNIKQIYLILNQIG